IARGTGTVHFRLPPSLTAGLRSGSYTLTVSAPELTGVPQPLVIGPGVRPASLHTIQYGDYAPQYPTADLWDAPDRVAARVDRTAKLGFNLIVDRLGTQLNALAWDNRTRAELEPLVKRLRSDAHAVAPEKAMTAPPLLQTVSGYSAQGVQEMAI